MSECVLDASAVLATLKDEPGSERVTEALDQVALISTVNLAEVATKLVDDGLPLSEATRRIAILPLSVVDYDVQLAYRTAGLRPDTRHRGLSLGDRACLALAQARGVTALTTEHLWAELDVGVEVEVIR